jgi:hypothetical protein
VLLIHPLRPTGGDRRTATRLPPRDPGDPGDRERDGRRGTDIMPHSLTYYRLPKRMSSGDTQTWALAYTLSVECMPVRRDIH